MSWRQSFLSFSQKPNNTVFFSGSSKSKAQRQIQKRGGNAQFIGGPAGDGTSGKYVLTGTTPSGTRPAPAGRGSIAYGGNPIYMWIPDAPKAAPKPAPKPAPQIQTPVKSIASTPYKPVPVTTASNVTKTAAPAYDIASDPAYKALQERLSSLTGQISGLGSQLTAAQSATQREVDYRRQAEERLDAITKQNAYNQAMNPQPGGVKTKRSEAYEQGLTGRGSTGYFGRRGLRITNLNL